MKVYEDDLTLAIMDIMPQAPGHVLALSKEPAVELFGLSDESAAACIRTTKKLATAVKAAMGAGHHGRPVQWQRRRPDCSARPFPYRSARGTATLRPHASAPADIDQLRGIAARIIAAMPA